MFNQQFYILLSDYKKILRLENLLLNEQLLITLFVFPSLLMSVIVSPYINYFFSIKYLKFFGDISYSIYLLHVPIQLFIFLIILTFDYSVDFSSHFFFFSYVIGVFIASYLSTYYFEKPLKIFIRNRFNKL